MAIKVVKRETLKVYGLSTEQQEIVKDSLTVTNPAYISAKRFSKWNNVRIPKFLTFYDVHKDYMELPLGYDLGDICTDNDEFVDKRILNTIPYPQIQIGLRDKQKLAFRAWIDDTDKGIICMPTGMGKSILGIYCAYAMRQKTLVIVHKNDLVTGWQEDCKVCFGDNIKTGLIKAAKRNVGDQITIATIQTLNSWAKNDLTSFEKFVEQFGMVIVDEMHHIAGSIYDLVNHFPAYYRIGLTATPERTDGLSDVMYWYLGKLAYKYEYEKSNKDILPVRVHILTSKAIYDPKCYQIPTGKSKDGTKQYRYVLESEISAPDSKWDLVSAENVPVKRRPRLNFAEIDDRAVTSQMTMNTVCSSIKQSYERGKTIVCFFSQKAHCQYYMDEMHKTYGIPLDTMCIYNGNYSREELFERKEKIESGIYKITFTTYSIATEGTNVKAWDTAYLISSINNGKNVEQAAGRIRRTKAGKTSVADLFDVRYPNVYALKNHKWKRDQRYKALKFSIIEAINPSNRAGKRFSIGY